MFLMLQFLFTCTYIWPPQLPKACEKLSIFLESAFISQKLYIGVLSGRIYDFLHCKTMISLKSIALHNELTWMSVYLCTCTLKHDFEKFTDTLRSIRIFF